MVWQKNHDAADLDEKLHALREDPFDEHPVMVTLPEDYVVALEAKVLRHSAILYSSRELTDGAVIPSVLPMLAANAQVRVDRAMPAMNRLVKIKLLKKRNKRAGGGWEIPNFLKYNPSKDQVTRRRQREKRLEWLQKDAPGKQVRDMIKKRDAGRCRYCYLKVSASDHRSPLGMTYDHVDPNGPDKHPDNIVVSCRFHNGMKLDRTPEAAGLVLLPPWGAADDQTRATAATVREVAMIVAATLDEHDPDPETIVAAVKEVLRTRSRPTETQPGPNRGPVATQSESNRSLGSGRVGLDLDGPDRVGDGTGASSNATEHAQEVPNG